MGVITGVAVGNGACVGWIGVGDPDATVTFSETCALSKNIPDSIFFIAS